jgi:O-antigen ligase
MNVIAANPSSKYFRLLAFAGILSAYALFAYKLPSLPDKWLGMLTILFAAVIGLLWIGQRHLALLTALVVAIPLTGFDFSLYYDEKFGGDHRIAASLLDFTLLALWLKYMISVPRQERRSLQPRILKWLLGGLFFLAVLSANFAKEPSLTMFEVIRLFRMIMVVIVANSVNTPRALRHVVTVLFIMTILEGFLAYAQKLSGGQLGIELVGEPDKVMTQKLNTGDVEIRVGGTFGHANQLARFLGLVLPLALAVAIAAENKRYRLLAGATLVIGGIALVATLSRGAWIGAALGCGLVFFAMILRPALRQRALRGLRLVLLLMIPFVLINLNTFIARFTSRDQGSFATREPMARIALQIIQDHPLGVGFGNYRQWLPSYGDPAIPFTLQAKVHNMYLLLASELGIAGLIVFLAILGTIWWRGLTLAKQASPEVAMIGIGIAGGLVAFAIHCLVDYEEIARVPILWFYFGLVCAMTKIISNGKVDKISNIVLPTDKSGQRI